MTTERETLTAARRDEYYKVRTILAEQLPDATDQQVGTFARQHWLAIDRALYLAATPPAEGPVGTVTLLGLEDGTIASAEAGDELPIMLAGEAWRCALHPLTPHPEPAP